MSNKELFALGFRVMKGTKALHRHKEIGLTITRYTGDKSKFIDQKGKVITDEEIKTLLK